MSVEFETDRAALAGSTGINAATDGESDAEGALNDPGANAGQDGTPKRRGRGPGKPKPGVLVLTCDRCARTITGSGAGYAYVSLVDTGKTAHRAAAGYQDPAKARWTLAHRTCAPEALAPMSPHFRLWAERITTTDDLLDAMVTLSRHPWFAHTDWQGLVRQVRADTETAATKTETELARNQRLAERRRAERAEEKRQAVEQRKRQQADELNARREAAEQRRDERAEQQRQRDEARQIAAQRRPEHGTLARYRNWDCRCDECKSANTEYCRQVRQKTAEKRIKS